MFQIITDCAGNLFITYSILDPRGNEIIITKPL
jgi:hypothetical protein